MLLFIPDVLRCKPDEDGWADVLDSDCKPDDDNCYLFNNT